MTELFLIFFFMTFISVLNCQYRSKYNGDCRRHRQEILQRQSEWIPECDDNGRYRPMQCRPGTSASGAKQCQCFSPHGDILSQFPNNGYGNVVSCNCYFENDYYRNRGQQGYDSVTYGNNMYYGNKRRSNVNYGNQVVGRNFYDLGWQPERQPTCLPDGRYQIRRRCSSDGYCWCIDDYGMIKSERRRDRNLVCT